MQRVLADEWGECSQGWDGVKGGLGRGRSFCLPKRRNPRIGLAWRSLSRTASLQSPVGFGGLSPVPERRAQRGGRFPTSARRPSSRSRQARASWKRVATPSTTLFTHPVPLFRPEPVAVCGKLCRFCSTGDWQLCTSCSTALTQAFQVTGGVAARVHRRTYLR